ncbi:hypothetical protein C4K38_1865 [Pseudomonas chlororaphis subsp. piscium]|nr:hypothetical protein C4K38_1865 [Pseudomonas chlororaphis subsp. piscium]
MPPILLFPYESDFSCCLGIGQCLECFLHGQRFRGSGPGKGRGKRHR